MTPTATIPLDPPLDLSGGSRLSLTDRFARVASGSMFIASILFTAVILLLLGLVIGYLVSIGIGSLNLAFFTKTPGFDAEHPGGMLNGIVGTGVLVGIASLIGIPLGMLTGVYLSEYDAGSWIAAPVRFVSDVLAGVPSIVVGILGYELLVVPASSGAFDNLPYLSKMHTFNGWAGAVALAFLMVPIVTRTTEEMLRLVPNSYREASIALGASKSRTILTVVIPAATGSVVTGIMLAIARVAGETAPLLFTALGSRYMAYDPATNFFPSLTVQIFDNASDPRPEIRGTAWAGTLVLIGLIFVLNLSIRFFTSRGRTV